MLGLVVRLPLGIQSESSAQQVVVQSFHIRQEPFFGVVGFDETTAAVPHDAALIVVFQEPS